MTNRGDKSNMKKKELIPQVKQSVWVVKDAATQLRISPVGGHLILSSQHKEASQLRVGEQSVAVDA